MIKDSDEEKEKQIIELDESFERIRAIRRDKKQSTKKTFPVDTPLSQFSIRFDSGIRMRFNYPDQIRYQMKDARLILAVHRHIVISQKNPCYAFKRLNILNNVKDRIMEMIDNYPEEYQKRKKHTSQEFMLYRLNPVIIKKEEVSAHSILYDMKILVEALCLSKYWYVPCAAYGKEVNKDSRLTVLGSLRLRDFERMVRLCIFNYDTAQQVGAYIGYKDEEKPNEYRPYHQ